MEIKSKLFSENPGVTKELGEDIKEIADAEIEPHLQKELAEAVARAYLAPNTKAEARAVEAVRVKWPADARTWQLFLSIGSFVLREMGESDTAESIIADFVGLHIAEQSAVDAVKPFLEGTIQQFQEIVLQEKRDVATQQFGPKILRGLACRADLRGVVNSDEEDESTEIASLVPTGIVSLRLSGDDEVVFQVNYRTLDIARKKLDKLRAQMDALIKYVGEDKVHMGRISEDE